MSDCNCSPFHVCYDCQGSKDDRDVLTTGEIVNLKVALNNKINTLSEQEMRTKLINMFYHDYVQDIRSGFATYDVIIKELTDE